MCYPDGNSASHLTKRCDIAWQNAPSSPTSTAQYLYDGEGNRVEQQTTTSGTTTTTVYVAGVLEEIVSNEPGTSLAICFIGAGGLLTAQQVSRTSRFLMTTRSHKVSALKRKKTADLGEGKHDTNACNIDI